MVFLAESRAAFGLFTTVQREKLPAARPAAAAPCAGALGAAERAFDIAEVMEEGWARELVSGFTQPLPQSASLWKFHVVRSDDRLEYRLYCNEGEFLMYAKVFKSQQCVKFFLYDPLGHTGDLHDPDRPAFTLRWNPAKAEWKLLQHQSDDLPSPKLAHATFQDQREVMSVQHSWQSVGDGVNLCMDIAAAATEWSEELCLTTKPPEWNHEVESLVMDFKGRQILSSPKNFQLMLEEAPNFGAKDVVCQHGKIGANTFGLDFKYPLTLAQAFAISMTTLFWK